MRINLDAGARFVGKTQTEEMVWSLSGLSTHLPSAINPKASNRTTGGSSSGSAAVVSAGEVDIALCSDTIGSIRGPASFCGIIGIQILVVKQILEVKKDFRTKTYLWQGIVRRRFSRWS